MKTIAIGPERDIPSWNWVGFDTARELDKYFNVIVFDEFKDCPKADVILIIKQRPPLKFVKRAIQKGLKVIYCPIDVYNTLGHLYEDVAVLRSCSMIISHCERLIPTFKQYCPKVNYVDHNNKYALPYIADYKKQGYILWIGGFHYVPYLLNWVKSNPFQIPLKILTDINTERARIAGTKLAERLKIPFNLTGKTVNDIPVYEWNEAIQFEMMEECKAAVDIKGINDWNQYNKPPTKAQKFVASGIPFAMNSGSYSTEYFKHRGFDVVSPIHQSVWFSEEYWLKTKAEALKLRVDTSIETIGLAYKKFIESV